MTERIPSADPIGEIPNQPGGPPRSIGASPSPTIAYPDPTIAYPSPAIARPDPTIASPAPGPTAGTPPPDLQAAVLRTGYQAGTLRVSEVVAAVYDRIEARGDDAVWISLVPRDQALRRAAALDEERDALVESGPTASEGAATGLPPLFGLPFAVKDNIDLTGLPTTAGCPGFAYEPATSAPAIDALLAAGAVCVGKTNLDQFATGLSGARSPYGTPVSPFDPTMISGGSSSGSAVAVAAGLVTFAIGTDTAGSGRVPAALTNTVGLKPSRGLVSTRGLVPACRSLDCLSVFALSVPDARLVLSVMNGYDAADVYSRRLPLVAALTGEPRFPPRQGVGGNRGRPIGLRLGVARPDQLTFLGDHGAQRVYETGLALLGQAGGHPVDVDLAPFLAAGSLLYSGPWLAERLASVGEFLAARPDEVHPVIRTVLEPGTTITGAEVFAGIARLGSLRRLADQVWDDIDVLVLPTVPTTFPVESVLADPIRLNAELGRYTTFVNLLDLAAIAVPVGFAAGLPHGVTLIAPAGRDEFLAEIASDLHARGGLPVGATGHPLAAADQPHTAGDREAEGALPGPAQAQAQAEHELSGDGAADHRPGVTGPAEFVDLAVVGAHMTGLALNGELTRLGAVLLRADRTKPHYRLYSLPGPEPRRPGLLRVPVDGAAIEAEVWRLPISTVGRFLLGVPSPLAIGTVELERGRTLGFLCEAVAVADADDITRLGGWRRYLTESRSEAAPTRVP